MIKSSTTEVRLLGQRIVLKSSETDPEVVREIVQLSTLKLTESEARNRGAAPHQIALMALLDLAEEYVRAKTRTIDFKQQVENQTTQLLGLVEADLK